MVGLNKVNYTSDPVNCTKDDFGKVCAKWDKYKTQDYVGFNPKKPYFVVFKDGYAGIDFDVPTKAKLERDAKKVAEAEAVKRKYESKYKWLAKEYKDKIMAGEDLGDPWELVKGLLEKFGLPTGDGQCFVVKSGTGGFHYYVHVKRPANFIFKPSSFVITHEWISVDWKCGVFTSVDTVDQKGTIMPGGVVGGGSLFFGEGTQWKDSNKYVAFKGSEQTIPEVEGWRVLWFFGAFDLQVAGFKLVDMLLGKLDVHGDPKAHEHELVIWKETMYALKDVGYTKDEVNGAFSTLSGYDQKKSENQINAWWDKEFTDPKRVKASLGKGGVAGQAVGILAPPANGSLFILHPIEPGKDEILMRDDGIFHVKTKHYKSGIKVDSPQIWAWKEFKIKEVLLEVNNSINLLRYNFTIDGESIRDLTLDAMLDLLYTRGHFQSDGKDKNFFRVMVKDYVVQKNIPVIPYSEHCGFTMDGWRMPDKYYVPFTVPWHGEQRPMIEAMLALQTNEADAKTYAAIIRDNISIGTSNSDITCSLRDVVLAFNTVAPFTFALMQGKKIDLRPMLGLASIGGETGKSSLLRVLVETWYGFPKEVNSNNFGSPSRAADYLSLSTFPVFIDDMGKLPIEIKQMLKSIFTGLSKHQKKDSSNKFFAINKSLDGLAYVTFNDTEDTDMLDDQKLLERMLILPVDMKLNPEKRKKFQRIIETVVTGYLGRYIYEITKDWTIKEIAERYAVMPGMPNAQSIRGDTIYKLIQLGAFLFKEFFGIELDVSGCEQLISFTLKAGSEKVFALLIEQLNFASMDKKERPKWIDNQVYCTGDDYRFTQANLADLQREAGVKMSLQSLAEVLTKRLPHTEYKKSLYMGDYTTSGVLIVKKDVEKMHNPIIDVAADKGIEVFKACKEVIVQSVLGPDSSNDGVSVARLQSLVLESVVGSTISDFNNALNSLQDHDKVIKFKSVCGDPETNMVKASDG